MKEYTQEFKDIYEIICNVLNKNNILRLDRSPTHIEIGEVTSDIIKYYNKCRE